MANNPRIQIILKINNKFYKFLSIFSQKNDPSFYIYAHHKNENSPMEFSDGQLLKIHGDVAANNLEKRIVERGDLVHISIHPNRLYIKKRSGLGKEEHLSKEATPQPFNEDKFRLLCCFTPAPPTQLPAYTEKDHKKSGPHLAFEWNDPHCPQLCIYELQKDFLPDKIRTLLSNSLIINSDGVHPTVAIQIKKTNGDPYVWKPISIIFSKETKKQTITKEELKKMLEYNKLNFNISMLPDNAIITDVKMHYPGEDQSSGEISIHM